MSTDMTNAKQSVNDEERPILQAKWPQSHWVRHIHQLLFSLNLAIGSWDLVCCYWHGLEAPFYRLDLEILARWNEFRHVPYTDFSTGYVGFWLPVMLLAASLWTLLELSSRTRFTRQASRSAAGFVALLLIPGLWIIPIPLSFTRAWVLAALRWCAPVEIAVAVFCTTRYIQGKWPLSASRTVALVLLHFGYWFEMTTPFPPSACFVPYLVGACSSLVWGAYLRFVRSMVPDRT